MTIWNMEITASESPQTVHIPLEGKYYAIKNTGDHDILVSSYVTDPTEGADDVMKIPGGSAAVITVKDGNLYVSAEEDGTYSVSIQDDKVIPWSGGTGSGGGGGTYKETQLYKYSGSGNVYGTITIAQGHKFSDYDQVLFCGEYQPGGRNKPDVFKYMPSSILENGVLLQRVTDFCHYHQDRTSPDTTIGLSGRSGELAITEIIGINY